jgi:signal transduction histidine kinase
MQKESTPHDVLRFTFPGIDDRHVKEMIEASQLKSYPAETVLCQEGAYEDVFYIIISGQVRVTKQLNMGEERLLKLLEAGSFFGEMAVIQSAPRTASVVTTQPSTVLELNYQSFHTLLESNKNVTLTVIREVTRRLRENDEMAIEELRMKARELAAAYQQLAEDEYARSEFLSTVANELRTPLMAANGYLQMIRMGMIQGEDLNAALETVWRNLQEITSHTNDILFMQEVDLIPAEFKPLDLAAVVREGVRQSQAQAERLGIIIQIDAAPDLPRMQGSPRSLQRAIEAVIDNAVKFSPDGGEVQVRIRAEDGLLRLEVQDFGVGIPPEALPRIFKRFFHLDAVGGRIFRGMGLGLAIASQVIEQHHGKIQVQSELGAGSTFTLSFPTE